MPELDKLRELQAQLLSRVVAIESRNGGRVHELEERLRRLELELAVVRQEARGAASLAERIIEAGWKVVVAVSASLLAWRLK